MDSNPSTNFSYFWRRKECIQRTESISKPKNTEIKDYQGKMSSYPSILNPALIINTKEAKYAKLNRDKLRVFKDREATHALTLSYWKTPLSDNAINKVLKKRQTIFNKIDKKYLPLGLNIDTYQSNT
jgi:hypothetical protein